VGLTTLPCKKIVEKPPRNSAGLNFQRRPVGLALERDRWKKIVESKAQLRAVEPREEEEEHLPGGISKCQVTVLGFEVRKFWKWVSLVYTRVYLKVSGLCR
jgi:hypothetical protein